MTRNIVTQIILAIHTTTPSLRGIIAHRNLQDHHMIDTTILVVPNIDDDLAYFYYYLKMLRDGFGTQLNIVKVYSDIELYSSYPGNRR
jgi:hypothetical protein